MGPMPIVAMCLVSSAAYHRPLVRCPLVAGAAPHAERAKGGHSDGAKPTMTPRVRGTLPT